MGTPVARIGYDQSYCSSGNTCGLQRLAHNPRAAGTDGRNTSLRILVLYANPVTVSFGATLHREVVRTLRSRGHEIDDCDLYAERFDPVLSEQERMQYHDLKLNRAHIDAYADRLMAAEALILVYPVWNEGFPAILKGFFDRVFIPGVSFTVGPDGALVTNLQKLRKDRCRLHLWSRPYHQFLARRPSEACGETFSALDARPSRSLRLSRLLRHGSFNPGAAGSISGEG